MVCRPTLKENIALREALVVLVESYGELGIRQADARPLLTHTYSQSSFRYHVWLVIKAGQIQERKFLFNSVYCSFLFPTWVKTPGELLLTQDSRVDVSRFDRGAGFNRVWTALQEILAEKDLTTIMEVVDKTELDSRRVSAVLKLLEKDKRVRLHLTHRVYNNEYTIGLFTDESLELNTYFEKNFFVGRGAAT